MENEQEKNYRQEADFEEKSNREIEQWLEYKTNKAVEFVKLGYSVSWELNTSHYITVFTPLSHDRVSYIADAKFFMKPSANRIDGGTISKLLITKYHGPLENILSQIRPYSEVLYRYDRGLDVNLLEKEEKAKNLYEDVVRVFL